MFDVEFSKDLVRKLKRIKKKNKRLFDSTVKKIRKIKRDPERYKPLRHDLKNYKRVHVQRPFVLVFKVDHANKKIVFIDLDHHDNIYKEIKDLEMVSSVFIPFKDIKKIKEIY